MTDTTNVNDERAEQEAELNEAFFPKKKEQVANLFARWIEPLILFLLLGAYVAVFLLFGAIGRIENSQKELQRNQQDVLVNQEAGKERGFQIRAVSCESVIIDNDRRFALSDNCTEDDVIKYYPPGVCEYLGNPPVCGTKYEPSPYPDPPRAGG